MLFRRASGMKAYTIHERPAPPVSQADRAEDLVFVKDGFCLFAALAPPIWMIANRLWLALAGYVSSVSLLIIIFGLLELADFWLTYGVLALHIIIGFEADSLIRWTLDRRAWRQIAHVTGRSSEECERRFFESWLPTIPEVSIAHMTPPGTPGGLQTSTSGASKAPLSGDVMPPKRRIWQAAFFRRR